MPAPKKLDHQVGQSQILLLPFCFYLIQTLPIFKKYDFSFVGIHSGRFELWGVLTGSVNCGERRRLGQKQKIDHSFKSWMPFTMPNDESKNNGKFHFAIDRGGTFTDVVCRLPEGGEVVSKLLSEDPSHYQDAPTEGIRRLLHEYDSPISGIQYPRGKLVNTSRIGSIRMGTTVATNALLEREGARMALVTTKGFGDLLEIGNQARPDIFDLSCKTPSLLYEKVIEVKERVILEEFCCSEVLEKYAARNIPRRVGVTKERLLVEESPDLTAIRTELEKLRDAGITALAIALIHAYTFHDHEILIGNLAREMGCFEQISMSHQVMPMVKLVPRGHTTSAAAYLTPKITSYLTNFQSGFDEYLSKVPLQFMKSDGGLSPVDDFGGHQAILRRVLLSSSILFKIIYKNFVVTVIINLTSLSSSTEACNLIRIKINIILTNVSF